MFGVCVCGERESVCVCLEKVCVRLLAPADAAAELGLPRAFPHHHLGNHIRNNMKILMVRFLMCEVPLYVVNNTDARWQCRLSFRHSEGRAALFPDGALSALAQDEVCNPPKKP